jgi:hypothetical protein
MKLSLGGKTKKPSDNEHCSIKQLLLNEKRGEKGSIGDGCFRHDLDRCLQGARQMGLESLAHMPSGMGAEAQQLNE